jgi:hypothetical protein
LWLIPRAEAQTAVEPPQAETELPKIVLPGVSLAQGLSEVTGVAVSPLLGVSGLGAWKYWQTAPSERARLPWYCHPYVWGTGLALLGICFLKDFLGAAAPALVKKPLDFLELFEDKLSALIASAGFVPLVGLAVAKYQEMEGPQAITALSGSGLAVLPLGDLALASMHQPWITIPVALVAFAVVWLSSHAIHVLIALSPFGIVDAGLKLTKLGLLTLVLGSALLNPYLGAAVSLLFILVGACVAGWSLRLTVFGTLMGRDFLLNKRARAEEVTTQGVRSFLARRLQGLPVRTLGKLTVSAEGEVCFVYRPWLLLPEVSVPIREAGLVLCKGLLHPSVAHRETPESRPRGTLILL